MHFTLRPLPDWPYPETRDRRGRYAFKASWGNTLELLSRELAHLSASEPVIGAGFREADLRMDGLPRSNARVPSHPGIEISFNTPKLGRLVYRTDSCEWWEHNVRSIALGLEALRAVDRYGMTGAGQQYAGFRALPAGGDEQLRIRGAAIVRDRFGGDVRAALRATHPDAGGQEEDFKAVSKFRELEAGT